MKLVKNTAADMPVLEAGRLKPLVDQFEEAENRRFKLLIAITGYLAGAETPVCRDAEA